MPRSIARRTVERATFFLERAELCGTDDRKAFEHFLEAAIVFGRSVTFHLQKEFGHLAGFESWYGEKQAQMASDPVFGFFKDKRNYILKEGPIPVPKTAAVAVTGTITFSSFVEARVTRAKPWYRRRPKIWLEDVRTAIVRPVRRWQYERRLAKKRKQHQQPTPTEVHERLHFEEPEWRDRAATDVLREYLLKLERLVAEAESRFGESENG